MTRVPSGDLQPTETEARSPELETIGKAGCRPIAPVRGGGLKRGQERKIQSSTPNLFWIVVALAVATPLMLWLILR